jgi:hypothetical protein
MIRRRARSASTAVFVLLLAALPGVASAQGGAANEAGAEALFTEGRALVEAGKLAEGCKKLEASQALDPGTGTLIHLADCLERLGRTASAWARFREAATRATRDGRADWESIAKTRAAELEPRLARLRVEASPGVAVRSNGAELPAAALGSALPVDPGDYVLTASARGKKSWSSRVAVAAAATVTITIPPLAVDPSSTELEGAPAARSSEASSPLRPVGYATGAVGLVGIVVGGVTGLAAISFNNRSKKACPDPGVCADDRARSDNDSARSAATVSTIAFVAGGALLAGGVALVLAAPSPSARASAHLRASPQAVWLEATW